MAQPSTAALTPSASARAHKELFPPREIENTSRRDRDFMKWLPFKDDFVGYSVDDSGGWYHIPYRFSKPQGVGHTLPLAQTASQGATNAAVGKTDTIRLARNRYYGYVTIDEEAAAASRSRDGAFYPVKEREIRELIEQVSEDLEFAIVNGQNGVRGQVASIADTVITLVNSEDVANFHLNMLVGFNTQTDGAGTDHGDSANPAQVVGMDYDAGTITLDVDLDTTGGTITAVAADDYIFRSTAEDVSAAGDAGNLIYGLADWIPLSAETSGTFNGLDRTQDVVRLQGFRQADVGGIELTIKKLFAKMMKLGSKPDSIWLSYENWSRLEQELGSRAYREDGKPGTFGLPALMFNTPKGKLPIYAASFMPEDRGYMLRRKDWAFLHLNGVPHIAIDGTGRERFLTGADAVEVRVRWWGQLACFNMFHQGVFNITSL